MKHLLAILTITGAALAQEGPGGPRGGPEGGFMRFNPVLAALDADHDGTISASELAGASSALRALDKNGDGQLTRDEVRPAMGGGRGGPQGQGGGSTDLVSSLMQFDKDGDGKLSKEEVPERMQGLFKRGDTNKDGFLTADELKVLAAAQASKQGGGQRQGGRERQGGGPGGGPRGMMRPDPVFAALDTDGDGTISAAELTNAAVSLKKLDKNNDGALTSDEVRPAFGGRGGPGGNPEEMISRMFEQFDANGDGKLSKDEMPERMQEMFADADANKDGFVSKDEMKKAMEARMGGFNRERRGERE